MKREDIVQWLRSIAATVHWDGADLKAVSEAADMLEADYERQSQEGCQHCGRKYPEVYRVPNAVWAEITPKKDQPGAGLLCMACAESLARAHGFSLFWTAIRVPPAGAEAVSKEERS